MRFALLTFALSGILACRSSQPQTAQQQPRGAQIGQSTAPLPADPSAPPAHEEGPDEVNAPISTPPGQSAPGDVGSPVSPGTAPAPDQSPTAPTAPTDPNNPSDPTTTPYAGVGGDQPVPEATPDAGIAPSPDVP